MKTLLWKFRFARHFSIRCWVPWKFAWQVAESTYEGFQRDIDDGDYDPVTAAEDEIQAWQDSQ